MTNQELQGKGAEGLTVETFSREDFLEVEVSGTYDLTEAIDRFPQVLEAARVAATTRVLIDYR